jgi:hypothetical protein
MPSEQESTKDTTTKEETSKSTSYETQTHPGYDQYPCYCKLKGAHFECQLVELNGSKCAECRVSVLRSRKKARLTRQQANPRPDCAP